MIFRWLNTSIQTVLFWDLFKKLVQVSIKIKFPSHKTLIISHCHKKIFSHIKQIFHPLFDYRISGEEKHIKAAGATEQTWKGKQKLLGNTKHPSYGRTMQTYIAYMYIRKYHRIAAVLLRPIWKCCRQSEWDHCIHSRSCLLSICYLFTENIVGRYLVNTVLFDREVLFVSYSLRALWYCTLFRVISVFWKTIFRTALVPHRLCSFSAEKKKVILEPNY